MNNSKGASLQQSRKNSNENIQVYVRVRPLNARERCLHSAEVIDVVSPREIVTRHSFDSKLTKKFTFDRAFGYESQQSDVYRTVVYPLIDEVLSGYNCTVFAYGQTGTGKTHTMIGTECARLGSCWEDNSDIGIIPRALSHLFDELRLMELEFSMRISYLELYNEELVDLLSSDDSTKIRIFDDSTKKGSVIIQGLEEIVVHSKDDVYKLLEKGKERRKTASTLMNAQSSRSHTVFSILVHIRENGIDGEEMLKIGKLNLVDLAGSENVNKSGNEKGIRVRETVNINQSLLTLGRVITALVERTPHIPYRESKLTRLLQESLGGRTKTSIIATISPGHKDIEETLSTLEYAHRAKNIQNKPEVNQKLTKKIVLKEYTEEIDKLKRDLMAARDKNGIYLAEETYNEITIKMNSQNRELNEKMLLLKALKDELLHKENIFNEVSLNLVEKTEELKRKDQTLISTKNVLLKTQRALKTTNQRYKEKKMLLDSHVKTENNLTSQALQLLEVADTASQDTQQLHSTIERRKDVDGKIQSACENFAVRMRNNFQAMDQNLFQLQEQHKTYLNKVSEGLTNNREAQNKMLSDTEQKIANVQEVCKQSLFETNAIDAKYSKMMEGLSREHKRVFESLLEELRNKELNMQTKISANLNDLESQNKDQKLKIEVMSKDMAEILKRSTKDMQSFTENIKDNFSTIMHLSNASINRLEEAIKEIDKARSLETEEQTVINEFLAKLQKIKEERTNCCNDMQNLKENLEKNQRESIVQLQQAEEVTESYQQNQQLIHEFSKASLQEESTALLQDVHKSHSMCAAIKEELKDQCEGTCKLIDNLATSEVTHCIQVEQVVADNTIELQSTCQQKEKIITYACAALNQSVKENMQSLRNLIARADADSSALKDQLYNYSKTHKQQMSNCASDVETFKQSELQTYVSTGTTPAKRSFVYPRDLAATSPHETIVKRLREENDWSDLDTTNTIEEDSECEEQDSLQILSDTDIVLNSTPIEVNRAAPNNIKNNVSGNTLRPYLRNSSLNTKNSPRKISPKITINTPSPSILEKNKENVT